MNLLSEMNAHFTFCRQETPVTNTSLTGMLQGKPSLRGSASPLERSGGSIVMRQEAPAVMMNVVRK